MKTYQYTPDAQASAFHRHAENACTRLRVGLVLAVQPVGSLLPIALQLASTQDWPDRFETVVADDVKVVVQRRGHVGVADDEFDYVADLQVLRLWAESQFVGAKAGPHSRVVRQTRASPDSRRCSPCRTIIPRDSKPTTKNPGASPPPHLTFNVTSHASGYFWRLKPPLLVAKRHADFGQLLTNLVERRDAEVAHGQQVVGRLGHQLTHGRDLQAREALSRS